MAIAEHIAGFTDKELAALNDNVRRLLASGTVRQRADAEHVQPLVDAEMERRKGPSRKKTASKRKKVRTH